MGALRRSMTPHKPWPSYERLPLSGVSRFLQPTSQHIAVMFAENFQETKEKLLTL